MYKWPNVRPNLLWRCVSEPCMDVYVKARTEVSNFQMCGLLVQEVWLQVPLWLEHFSC